MEIRDATAEDAEAAATLLRRSITDLCIADHGNDPEILARWVANKTPETVSRWIGAPTSSLLVADEMGIMLGVGGVTDAGEITLNYVAPEARFRGVSKALLRALEAWALGHGNAGVTLTSTQTARRFYLSAGYTEGTPRVDTFGVANYPMSKPL